MLELESGSNDPIAYTLTFLLLSLMGGDVTGGMVVRVVLFQLLFGLACGAALSAAVCGSSALPGQKRRLRAASSGGCRPVSYALPTAIGGNGYLSAYLVGIVLGAKSRPDKKELVHFLDGITSLMQLALFFLLGLLSFPSRLPAVLPAALGVMASSRTFAARPAAVALLLAPFRAPIRQQLLVSWAGLRGATSIVFAIMAVIDPAAFENDLFHIAFCVVLLFHRTPGDPASLVRPAAGNDR